MVRNYQRKTAVVDEAKIAAGIAKVESGVSIRQAATEEGIPESTLRYHLHARNKGVIISKHGGRLNIPLEVQAYLADVNIN